MEDMNCVWLNKQNPYDILCKIQDDMVKSKRCILRSLDPPILFDERYGNCPNTHTYPITPCVDCHKCIEKWMVERRTK